MNYQKEMAEILQKAQRDIIYKAIDAIEAENKKMRKILEGGYDIYYQSQGQSYYRIQKLRDKIWLKIDTNRKTIGKLWDIVHTECIKH